ncbi:glycosyltransferase family 4 protein [Rhodovulum sp. BSW8]|uniref:glycosyltransferase family 4 protein n=1 Tax=Rhodovulum sp. BSW8 TaxID=2259645 RepID=UPI001058C9A3|nr:glycosyltransferase family 4 protein [Rhodovulum sp. BSW8]
MKILVICHDHPAFTDGGTEHAAHDLCRTLDARPGISARFLAASTSLTHPEVRPGSLHGIGRDLLLRTGAYDAFSMRRMDGTDWTGAVARVLETVEPDIVHLHGLDRIGAEIVPLIRRLRPAARLVLTLHDFQAICPADGLMLRRDGGLCTRPAADACRRCLPQIAVGAHALRKARLLAILDQIDAILAPSRDLRDRFVAWGLPAERIAVLPNAVAPLAPPATTARPRPNRFAYFGNLAPHKGVGVLLAAAADLAGRGADLRLALHGRLNHPAPEAEAAFAEGLAAAAPLARHLGPYDRDQVHGLMAEADWVVIPSLWYENAPLVALEAQRAGRPVICTAQGGLKELVRDGIDGLHVPRADPVALADRMEAVAADPALWARLSANLRPPPTLEDSARWHLDHYSRLTEVLPA